VEILEGKERNVAASKRNMGEGEKRGGGSLKGRVDHAQVKAPGVHGRKTLPKAKKKREDSKGLVGSATSRKICEGLGGISHKISTLSKRRGSQFHANCKIDYFQTGRTVLTAMSSEIGSIKKGIPNYLVAPALNRLGRTYRRVFNPPYDKTNLKESSGGEVRARGARKKWETLKLIGEKGRLDVHLLNERDQCEEKKKLIGDLKRLLFFRKDRTTNPANKKNSRSQLNSSTEGRR